MEICIGLTDVISYTEEKVPFSHFTFTSVRSTLFSTRNDM